MGQEVIITGTVAHSPAKGGWYYIGVPAPLLAKLWASAGKNGPLPVVTVLGKSTWRTTIMSRGNQQWYLAIKADVREQENISAGDKISCSIVPDFDKLTKVKEKV